MRLSLTKYCNTVLTIIIVPLTLFPLCFLFLVPRTTSTVSLCSFYFCSLLGKLTVFFQCQEFNLGKQTTYITVARCSPRSSSQKWHTSPSPFTGFRGGSYSTSHSTTTVNNCHQLTDISRREDMNDMTYFSSEVLWMTVSSHLCVNLQVDNPRTCLNRVGKCVDHYFGLVSSGTTTHCSVVPVTVTTYCVSLF